MQIMYETEGIILTPFTEKHITEEYMSWFHNQEVTKYNSHGLFPYTRKAFDEFVETVRNGSSNMILLAMIVAEPHDSFPNTQKKYTHIGNISLQRIDWTNRSAEFAIVIGNTDYWNKGYGTEAGQLLLTHGFEKLNLHRIWTGTAATNIGMKTLAIKLGMVWEGTFNDGVFLEGQYVDVNSYAILEYRYYDMKHHPERYQKEL